MRSTAVLTAFFLTLLLPVAASAGCPDPATSGCGVSASGAPCQYRFRADGTGDQLTVLLTLRHAFGYAMAACSTSATVELTGPNPANACWDAEAGSALASCDGLVRYAFTDSEGIAQFQFSGLCGRGSGDIVVRSHCFCPTIEICRIPFRWTSSALTGAPIPGISDLGVWASSLAGAAFLSADYNCDCAVGVADLGYWAGGLGRVCGP